MSTELSTHRKGLTLALATALISGFAVFLNGYAVRAWSEVADATTYTTVKNLLAAAMIGVFGIAMSRSGSRRAPSLPKRTRHRKLLLVIALVGGSVPFVLFFEGLARANSAQAALIHKTLVVWVAVLAFVFLRERIGWPHLVAIGLLVWGQGALSGGLGSIGVDTGEIMIFAATLLWSIEIVIAKRLLPEVSYATVADFRMIGGAGVLMAWALLRGVEIDWFALTVPHLAWAGVAALFLSGYVLTWFAALSMAPAVDVTAVLVAGALVTAFLQATVQGAPMPDPVGAAVVLAAIALVGVVSWNRLGVARQ